MLGHTDMMDLAAVLDIILQYLKVLAWPLVVLILAIVYRRPIVTLLERLKKYSGWGQTVELGDFARDLNAKSAEVVAEVVTAEPEESTTPTPETPSPPTADPPLRSYLVRPTPVLDDHQRALVNYLSNLDPQRFAPTARDMIERAWSNVNEVANQIRRELDLSPWAAKGLTMFSHALVQMNLISIQTANLAAGLDELHRNIQRADDDDITPYVVSDFVSTAENLQQALTQVRNTITLDRLLNAPDPEEIVEDPSPQTRP